MPIFMDRHDMRGSTAENIAEAHRKDLEIQDKYGVKYMTYWYDPERSTGFCLVEAPDAETAAHVARRMDRSRQTSSPSISRLWKHSSAASTILGMLRAPLRQKWEPGFVPSCLLT